MLFVLVFGVTSFAVVIFLLLVVIVGVFIIIVVIVVNVVGVFRALFVDALVLGVVVRFLLLLLLLRRFRNIRTGR